MMPLITFEETINKPRNRRLVKTLLPGIGSKYVIVCECLVLAKDDLRLICRKLETLCAPLCHFFGDEWSTS